MDSKILLGKILQRLQDQGYCKVKELNRFGFVEEKETLVIVSRQRGKNTKLYFKKILVGIEGYQTDTAAYDKGPSELRAFGLTHVTSPIFALLHLLPKDAYSNPKR